MSEAPPDLHVIARAPFELYYDGPASSVSAINRIGPFDILPGHADFFSMLRAGQIIIEKAEGDPIQIDAHNGIVTVRDNEVLLFVNI